MTLEVEVQNKLGLHARTASLVVRKIMEYDADVFVKNGNGEKISGKSILNLMTLAACKGTKVHFIATGKDAKVLLQEIEQLFNDKFGED